MSSESQDNSVQKFLSAFIFQIFVGAVELVLFVFLKNRYPKVYHPREYLVDPSRRPPKLDRNPIRWLYTIVTTDSKQLIYKNGLDSYLFLRLLRLFVIIFAPTMFFTWAVLMPTDAVKTDGQGKGMSIFAYGHVGTQHERYAAHIILIWAFVIYVLYLIQRELSNYIQLRQEFITSPEWLSEPKSRTVLVTDIPEEDRNAVRIAQLASIINLQVDRIWVPRDITELEEAFDKRLVASDQLEKAETKYLKAAAKKIRKTNKKAIKAGEYDLENPPNPGAIETYIPEKKRPHHKLGKFGLFGEKVDTIEYAQSEINKYTQELAQGRQALVNNDFEKYPVEGAAFVQFRTQIQAQAFAQLLSHHTPLAMANRYVNVHKDDVIWKNLSMPPYRRYLRGLGGWAATIALIIFWTIPVAFVSMVSNVESLCQTVPWMSWFCTILPSPVPGILSGALPPIAVGVLVSLVPAFLRYFCKVQGYPLHTEIELAIMDRFFAFNIWIGFITPTLGSGLISAVPKITANPGQAAQLLAENIAQAYVYFLTYFVTMTIGAAFGLFLQIAGVVKFYLNVYIMSSTPRSVFQALTVLINPAWGSTIPPVSLLALLGFCYTFINPIMSGFALAGFALLWLVYKYSLIWVIDAPIVAETGGRFFPIAIGHIFCSLYFMLILMAVLFILIHDYTIAMGVLCIVIAVITIFFHIALKRAYNPLTAYLPLDYGARALDTATTLGADGLPRFDASNPYAQSKAAAADDIHAYDSPATYENQRVIWLPDDIYGYSKNEIASIKANGISASSLYATMDAKSNVSVSRAPPDEEWLLDDVVQHDEEDEKAEKPEIDPAQTLHQGEQAAQQASEQVAPKQE